jgi:histidinol-phosphate aminotransferase
MLTQYYRCFDQLGIEYIPSGGNYVFFHLSSNTEMEDCAAFLQEKGIKVRKGDVFGFPNSIRVSTGSEEASRCFVEAMQQWKGK